MEKKRIHYFQHVPFEGIGYIKDWVHANGHELSCTRFYEGDEIPQVEDIDWLIIMGGPMDIYQDEEYSWLANEKLFIKQAIEAKKIVIGFCLGGQLIADVLGAKVRNNKEKEIGWFPVTFTEEVKTLPAFRHLISLNPVVFHWHQDIFDIPEGTGCIASSQCCDRQAFVYGDHVFAFQFHLETTLDAIKAFIENCQDDYQSGGAFVQQPGMMLSGTVYVKENNLFLQNFLDHLTST